MDIVFIMATTLLWVVTALLTMGFKRFDQATQGQPS
jgi:hypothetical protein